MLVDMLKSWHSWIKVLPLPHPQINPKFDNGCALPGRLDASFGSHCWRVYDLDRNEVIRRCVWADDSTGEVCVALTDEFGVCLLDDNGNVRTITRKFRFKFVGPGPLPGA
jgi:hypothetical protein